MLKRLPNDVTESLRLCISTLAGEKFRHRYLLFNTYVSPKAGDIIILAAMLFFDIQGCSMFINNAVIKTIEQRSALADRLTQ